MSAYDKFSMPSSFMDIRKRIADERTVLICLAVGFVASFLAMVSSSYTPVWRMSPTPSTCEMIRAHACLLYTGLGLPFHSFHAGW